jgi:signal transduction histidine kinase
MSIKKVLVVAGDYDIVQGVRQGLENSGCVVYAAHSHRDALYALNHEPFDLVVVDAGMSDRRSGELTLSAVSALNKRPPILIYKPNPNGVTYPDPVLPSLQVDALRAAVFEAMPDAPAPRVEVRQPRPASTVVTDLFWRDEEIQTLFSLSRSLTEVLDLSEVLNRVVEAARRLTNAEEGLILLPESDTDQLYLRAKVGIDSDIAANFRVKTQDTIAGHVFSSGQAILLGEAGPQKVKTQYFVNSLLYVPIVHKGRTLGVLGVNNKDKHDVFNHRHKELLINLASYAAIAIENARIYAQSVRRARELKALVDASQAINESLTPEYLLPAICDQLVRVLNVSYAEIYARDGETDKLYSIARCFQAKWRAGLEPVISLAERPALRLALDNRRHVLIVRDRHDVPNEIAALERMGANATLFLPIASGEQVIGVVQAYYLNAPAAAPDTLNRAARLVQENRLAGTPDDSAAPFLKVLAEVKGLLGADWVEFAALHQERRTLHTQYACGGSFWFNGVAPEISLDAYPDLRDMLDNRAAINEAADSESLTPGAATLIKLSRARSLLALPLMERGQAWGLVVFGDMEHNHRFSPREIDLARAIVAQAATALENSHLVSDLEASLRDLKEAQNRLIQTARLTAMGELAAAVAHQINNPLTTIVLDTELLLLKESAGTKTYDILSAISRAGKRAAGVVRRLLASARPNTNNTPPQPINVVQSVEEILTLVNSYLTRAGITLIRRLPDELLPPVMAVPGDLDDVWLNLILNAHDALTGRDDPQIAVEIAYPPDGDMTEVIVSDNGPGIPSEIMGEIFKPFFTTKPAGEGTGLGLHICRQVVDRVGGTITVDTHPNKGTTFRIQLPVIRSGVL